MRYILLLFAFALTACGSKFELLEPAAQQALENITCPNSESRLYDVLYASLVDLEEIPSKDQLRDVFQNALEKKPEFELDQEEVLNLVEDFYSIVLSVKANNVSEMLERLTALEVGDQTTPESKEIQNKLKRFQPKWSQFRAQQKTACSDRPPTVIPPDESLPERQKMGSMVYGARKVLAVAYQSCAANEKVPMTLKTPDVEGISRVGTHPDGVGGQRLITDLESVQKTHYYLQGRRSSPVCREVQQNPLIYDYGGKPYTTSDPNSSLDLFKNKGTGTSALGIDCSGYVFSAIASAGLKLHPDRKMKAILVNGINARMYMNPEANGMPCFEKVKMGAGGTLKAGDVIAVPGHIVIVESVAIDPLGIETAQTVSQCSQLTYKDFKFVVAQSSPSKNGIGINKYMAADYLQETGSIRSGLEKYARDACRAKFENQDVLMKAPDFQVIRHQRTPACTDEPIPLEGESCVQSCTSLTALEVPNTSKE